jgi:hypothetical protein
MGPGGGVSARDMGPADRQGHGATHDLLRRLTWPSGPKAKLTTEPDEFLPSYRQATAEARARLAAAREGLTGVLAGRIGRVGANAAG